jgi:ATP-dependent DNA helicase RecG
MLFVKQHGKITNSTYQELNETSHRTAARDLQELVEKELINKLGTTGKGTYYVLKHQV